MMAALPLLLVAAASDVAATQQRVDELVARCDAQGVIRLVAESARQVAMQPLLQPGETSAEQEKRFDCVLTGVKSMPDLNFGFVGNEEEPKGR